MSLVRPASLTRAEAVGYQRGYDRALALYNNSGITVIHPYAMKNLWWIEYKGKGEAVQGKRAAKKRFQELVERMVP